MAAIITLITDFGTQDGYVGAMKGTIASISPASPIIDITHEIAPQSILQAAFCLSRSAPHYPAGTIHVVVVDPGVGSNRPAIVVRTGAYWLVGPDNGVFSLLLQSLPPTQIIHVFPKTKNWETHSSFDGLALFSPLAAHLATGMEIDQIGDIVEDYQKFSLPNPLKTPDGIEGEILLFDRFGNAITNISAAHLEQFKKGRAVVMRKPEVSCLLQSHYQAGANEKNLAIINSDRLLELSVFGGTIEEAYGLVVGDKVRVIEENRE